MVAQVGKTSLILSLVSEEFPEEVSCPNLSLTYLLTLRLTIVNQFLFTFRSMFNLYISFEINVLRIIYLAVTVLCNLLWHSLTTPLPAHHLVRDNYTPMVLLQCPFQNKKYISQHRGLSSFKIKRIFTVVCTIGRERQRLQVYCFTWGKMPLIQTYIYCSGMLRKYLA